LLLDIRQVEVALDYDLLEAVKMLSLLKSLFLGGAYYSTDFPRAKLLTIEASWSTPTTWLVFFAFAVMRIAPTYFSIVLLVRGCGMQCLLGSESAYQGVQLDGIIFRYMVICSRTEKVHA
jgi:hypothetical protein